MLTALYQIHAGTGTIGSFAPDAYYTGGTLYSVTTSIDTTGVVNAAPMAVYQTQRFGNFSYVMPSLTPGDTYLVRLHFAETFFTLPGQRLGNVAINGTTVLADFDIALAAGAVNKALVEEFAAVADGSGNITIAFTTVTNFPAINAVEILRSVPSVGTTRFLYDPNGSLLSATTPDGSVTTYLWDAANRLQSVAMPSGYMATQTYRWDDLRVNQVSSSGLETWTWDGQNVLAWSGPSNPPGGGITTSTSLMAMGPNLVRAVGADTDGSPLDRQFHLDHQGSVQALTSGSSSLEQDYQMDAWGNELTSSASTNRSVYLGGLGYWQEPSLGLNYVRARWMDPITGRWLSVDSVPTEPRYLYAGNSPTLRVDPSGRNFEDSHDTRPRSQRQTRPTAAPADQSIIDQFMKLVNVHLPELQHFVQDPETVGKELILHYNELVWHKIVEETADLAADLGINHIPDFVTRAVPGTFGLSRSQWEAVRTRFPSLTPFLEPYPVSSRWIHWDGGFVWGLVKGIAEMAPALHPITNLIHGFDNLKALWSLFQALRAKGLSKLISEAWKATRNRFFNYFEEAVHKSAFDQGKLTGIIVANAVAIILAVLSGIGLLKDLGFLLKFIQESGVVWEMLDAYEIGGIEAAAKAAKSRVGVGADGTVYLDARKTNRVPVDLSGPNTVHPPTDGTGVAPRGQGVAPAAGNDPIAKAGQHVDAVTRKQLAGAAPTIERSGQFFSTARMGVVLSDDLLNGMKNKLSAAPRKEFDGLKLYIEGDDQKMDKGRRHPDVSGYYLPRIKGKRAPRIWLKQMPTRLDAFEELYHYLLDKRHDFPGQYDEITHLEDEREVSIALLYLKISNGESAPGLGTLCHALGLGPVFDDVLANGWTGKELISIDRYLLKHENDISDYQRRNSALADQADKEYDKLRKPKP